jgi:hypothetical protein
MYGERSICNKTQNSPPTANTTRTSEARAIALLLRGKICIENDVFIYCGTGFTPLPADHVGMIYVT